MTQDRPNDLSRRQFVQSSGAALAGLAATRALPAHGVHIGGDELLKVGLIGCGGRGSGAVVNALSADPQTKLIAMADLFSDRLDSSLQELQGSDVKDRVQVDEDHRFVGFNAYQQVIDSCDVILLAATPHFRPLHLKAAIDAGKHVFCEKPVAVDAPGVRSVMETCKDAARKRLSLVSGLCYRYDEPKQELMKRLHDGAVGDIVALECTYNTGGLWHRGRQQDWTELEFQIRNWLYFTWLSGDHIAEQSIHSLDKILWAMNDEPPKRVVASGGRIVRTDPKYGNVYDHFNTRFEWSEDLKLFHSCRQWEGADREVSDFVYGTKGIAAIQGHFIKGEQEWRFRGRSKSMYQREHDALFASIRSGEPINNGDYMCKSTLMAIMGRMSAYTGKVIEWDQALNSTEDFTLQEYKWGPAPAIEVARPGITQFH